MVREHELCRSSHPPTRERGEVFAFLSAGADTKASTPGCCVLQVGDLGLLEDGGERGGALVSDHVVVETVNERERAGVHERSSRQRALT